MKVINNLLAVPFVLFALCGCGSDDEDGVKDTQVPVVSSEGIVASPLNCDTYHRGQVIPLRFVLKDNVELGSYNVNIHNNFDHHNHSTEIGDCTLDAKVDKSTPEGKAKYANGWVFQQNYTVPEGLKTYLASADIVIPATIEPGDYHFMLTVTDKAGWQTIKAVSIKILE